MNEYKTAFPKTHHSWLSVMDVKIVFFLLHIDYNLYNQVYYKYNG